LLYYYLKECYNNLYYIVKEEEEMYNNYVDESAVNSAITKVMLWMIFGLAVINAKINM
jgi:ERCC4-type nuclease